MGVGVYLIFGALAGLTFLRAKQSRGAGGRALWIAAACGFVIMAAIAAIRGIDSVVDLAFYLVAIVSLVAALMVVSRDNPIHSAVWLITVLLCMAVLFVLRQAEFLAAVQVIIYAGAIMVLYVFIMMFVDVDTAVEKSAPSWMAAAALGIASLLMFVVAPVALVLGPGTAEKSISNGLGSVEHMGEAIYFGATLPFEAVSLILLVALIGAALIGKAEKQ